MVVFFFCNQKTAYEMRISDWSSDVCSSDLAEDQQHEEHRPALLLGSPGLPGLPSRQQQEGGEEQGRRQAAIELVGQRQVVRRAAGAVLGGELDVGKAAVAEPRPLGDGRQRLLPDRSEEHTSELQSLMRSSYAVFCLKKNNKKYSNHKKATTI